MSIISDGMLAVTNNNKNITIASGTLVTNSVEAGDKLKINGGTGGENEKEK